MKEKINILPSSLRPRYRSLYLLFSRGSLLQHKIAKSFTCIKEIESVATLRSTEYLPYLMLQLVQWDYLAGLYTLHLHPSRFYNPSYLRTSKIDYTGKSGFISIKAPALIDVKLPEPG